MTAYYNEYDKHASAWLRQLITNGMIAEGEMDERSIIDVQPNEIRGFDRVHWFGGIGGWDYALQLAGWGDEPVWTASLPCQPFSCAGKQLGKADERHLLPHFLELVDACRPPVIFGEQVPAAIKHGWLDDLCDEMERLGYTVRAAVLTAAGAGAPHIRARLYWVVYAESAWGCRRESSRERKHKEFGGSSEDNRAAYHSGEGLQKQPGHRGILSETPRHDTRQDIAGSGGMGNAESTGHKASPAQCGEKSRERSSNALASYLWANTDWLYCRDNKYRPIKSGLKPLVNGIPRGMVHSGDSGIAPNESQEARTMRLKGYGNAIVPQVAAQFIQAIMEIL